LSPLPDLLNSTIVTLQYARIMKMIKRDCTLKSKNVLSNCNNSEKEELNLTRVLEENEKLKVEIAELKKNQSKMGKGKAENATFQV
jgi:hypothetical protein